MKAQRQNTALGEHPLLTGAHLLTGEPATAMHRTRPAPTSVCGTTRPPLPPPGAYGLPSPGAYGFRPPGAYGTQYGTAYAGAYGGMPAPPPYDGTVFHSEQGEERESRRRRREEEDSPPPPSAHSGHRCGHQRKKQRDS